MKPANTNAARRADADIPFCPLCSPKARRVQSGGTEEWRYSNPPLCRDCPRAIRLRGLSGRYVTVEQDSKVREIYGLGKETLLYDFGGEVRCK